jgi:hypothetical protein
LKLIDNITSEQLFSIQTDSEFNEIALKIFHFQYKNCIVYREFCQHIKCKTTSISYFDEIPFLPIQFFKSKKIISSNRPEQIIFKSSGTMATGRSNHYVIDLELYENSFIEGFRKLYGNPSEFTFLALLPSYQEQGESSLVYMVDKLISLSKDARSGFYLNQNDLLAEHLKILNTENKPTVLFGVSYALLDLIEEFQTLSLPNLIIMETGGMKGRRKELPKEELHQTLMSVLKTTSIHSEYGMTELLSQGYSKGAGIFNFPNWIKPLIRQSTDPLKIETKPLKTGGINIIDLANIWSCSFIATQDLGKLSNLGLQIVGRFDHSDTRGCNLLLDL